ncbi:Dabb family protein [Paracoccaceae bacterium GXU_MW_L88]
MLTHIVMLSLKESARAEAISAIESLAGLTQEVDGMHALTHGENRDYEDKSGAYDYGFTVTFRDRAAHLAYEAHPIHQAAGQTLIAACKGGYGGIFVVDLESAD